MGNCKCPPIGEWLNKLVHECNAISLCFKKWLKNSQAHAFEVGKNLRYHLDLPLHFLDEELKPREVKWFVQGHTAGNYQRIWTQIFLIPSTVLSSLLYVPSSMGKLMDYSGEKEAELGKLTQLLLQWKREEKENIAVWLWPRRVQKMHLSPIYAEVGDCGCGILYILSDLVMYRFCWSVFLFSLLQGMTCLCRWERGMFKNKGDMKIFKNCFKIKIKKLYWGRREG